MIGILCEWVGELLAYSVSGWVSELLAYYVSELVIARLCEGVSAWCE